MKIISTGTAATILGCTNQTAVKWLEDRGIKPVAQVAWARGITRSYDKAEVVALARVLEEESQVAANEEVTEPTFPSATVDLSAIEARLSAIETTLKQVSHLLNILANEFGTTSVQTPAREKETA